MGTASKQRLKVLISAFACRPGWGSEPEVGWHRAMGMAQHHDITVLTLPMYRVFIEEALAELPPEAPRPKFRYFDGGALATRLHERLGGLRLYYMWWQRSARRVVAELHAELQFDLLHHVTFAGCRYSTAIWGHGVASIWGPVGGLESVPVRLLPWDNPLALCAEVVRNISNYMHSLRVHSLPRYAALSTVVLVSTRETQRVFENLGLRATLMPAIGLDRIQLGTRPVPTPSGPLELLFVGKLISLKGLDLAVQALADASPDARLTLVGEGPDREKIRQLAARLGVSNRVSLLGRLPLAEVLALYEKFHLFLFPSLHDSGGFAVLEAMARGLPVICLDCGGPAISVRDGCGIRVPLGSREDVVAGLSSAIRIYDEDRARIAADGERARAAIATHYDWTRQSEELARIYERAAAATHPCKST